MAAPKLKYAIGNSASTTLTAGVTNADTSFPLTSGTNFQAKSGAGMVKIDEGQATEELGYATTYGGGALTIPLANRGLEGGSAQAHNSSATVRGIFSALQWNDMIDALTNVLVASTGVLDTTKVIDLTTAQTMTNKTLTSPKIGTSILDTNGNEEIKITATGSAVNEITLANAATGNAPSITATGDDTDIDLKLNGKGAGEINLSRGYYQGFQAYTPAGAGTATLDLSLGNDHRITMPAGNITIAISNAKVGQKFLVSITQDSSGSRTVTWFTTLKWAGGTPPTLTTTANKRDTFGFVVTSAGNYDALIVGQNI